MMLRKCSVMPALAAAILSTGVIAPAQDAGAARPNIQWTKVPKQVLAFYYGWYGNADVSKRWVHWKNVDVAKKHIDESTHFPVMGAYDSHDPKIVDTHCRQAKEALLAEAGVKNAYVTPDDATFAWLASANDAVVRLDLAPGATGPFVGAIARYLVDGWVTRLSGAAFPLHRGRDE